MFRISFSPLALSLLPVLTVPLALSVNLPHQSCDEADANIPVLYQTPSPRTDPIYVRELIRLRDEIKKGVNPAGRSDLPRVIHSHLPDEYRLIVRETTPEALRRAGLPSDIR